MAAGVPASAVVAIHGPELDKWKAAGAPVPEELAARIAQTRADYERWLDVRYAAARGHVDGILDPLATRRTLSFLFDAAAWRGHRQPAILEQL